MASSQKDTLRGNLGPKASSNFERGRDDAKEPRYSHKRSLESLEHSPSPIRGRPSSVARPPKGHAKSYSQDSPSSHWGRFGHPVESEPPSLTRRPLTNEQPYTDFENVLDQNSTSWTSSESTRQRLPRSPWLLGRRRFLDGDSSGFSSRQSNLSNSTDVHGRSSPWTDSMVNYRKRSLIHGVKGISFTVSKALPLTMGHHVEDIKDNTREAEEAAEGRGPTATISEQIENLSQRLRKLEDLVGNRCLISDAPIFEYSRIEDIFCGVTAIRRPEAIKTQPTLHARAEPKASPEQNVNRALKTQAPSDTPPIATVPPPGDSLVSKHEIVGEQKKVPELQGKPLYVRLEKSVIPIGWSNHPGTLGVESTFSGGCQDDIQVALKHDFGMPDPRPVLVDGQFSYLVDGGNTKYYFYNEMTDIVLEIQESDLSKILAKMKNGSTWRLETKYLGEVEYDPHDRREQL